MIANTTKQKASEREPRGLLDNTTKRPDFNDWAALKQHAEAAGIEVRERNGGVVDCIRWGWAKRLHSRAEAAEFLASQGVRS